MQMSLSYASSRALSSIRNITPPYQLRQNPNLVASMLSVVPRREVSYMSVYHLVNWYIPHELDNEQFPMERRKLRTVLKVPVMGGSERPYKLPRRLIDIRGPELVHNTLIHEKYGLQALGGGNMKFGHFEMIRNYVNYHLEEKRMFAQWRVEAPWKPWTKLGLGKTLGGGKADIRFYVTPVKEGRIIFELGGHLTWWEAYKIIHSVAGRMPFKARFVSQEMLEQERKMEQYVQEKNVNPFTYEKCLQNNLMGCRQFVSPWHYHWGPGYH